MIRASTVFAAAILAAAAGAGEVAMPEASLEHLEKHVRVLAGEIGERNLYRPSALAEAAAYVERTFRTLGYSPSSQEYQAYGQPVRNIEVELPGEGKRAGFLVVGAHYDSAPGTPGANDNATGVAALLEIGRLLSGRRLGRTVRLVAFVNEEPPFFLSDLMGSRLYARRCRERGERIAGMLSLETIGYYSDRKGSQGYPFPLGLFYPSKGNFLGFVGDIASHGLVRESVRYFRREVGFPAEGAALPRWAPAVDLSDHASFWREGYRAVLVTDTAPFRYPHYHAPEDTPEKIDYTRFQKVVGGLAGLVAKLAGTPGSR